MAETKPENKKFIKPLQTKVEDRVEPILLVDENKNFRLYIEKVGYPWEMNGVKGLAERIKISLAKLDINGDPVGQKKQINLPASLDKAVLSKIFDAIMSVKDKPLNVPDN